MLLEGSVEAIGNVGGRLGQMGGSLFNKIVGGMKNIDFGSGNNSENKKFPAKQIWDEGKGEKTQVLSDINFNPSSMQASYIPSQNSLSQYTPLAQLGKRSNGLYDYLVR